MHSTKEAYGGGRLLPWLSPDTHWIRGWVGQNSSRRDGVTEEINSEPTAM
jgi:hypothetical protein